MRGLAAIGVLSIVPIVLAACAPSVPSAPVPFIDIRSANFGDMDNLTLCSIFSAHAFRSDEAKDELDRRQALTAEDWQRVIDHKLYAGMSECAMVAAFGPADQRYLFRDAVSGNALQIEYFYDCVRTHIPDCLYADVIVLDSKVHSWSPAQSTSLLGQSAEAPAPYSGPQLPTSVPQTPTVTPGDADGGWGSKSRDRSGM
jgi:hypothetical protein